MLLICLPLFVPIPVDILAWNRVLAMANLSNILTFVLGEPLIRGVSTTFANAISVTMLSRLMLNLQNPLLFEPNWKSRSQAQGDTIGTGTYVGPFVTTIIDRDGTTVSERRFDSGTGSGTTGTDSSRSGVWTEEVWAGDGEAELETELYSRPPRALWYDRAWVSGSASATATRTGSGTRGHVDEIVEEVELSPTLGARHHV